MYTTGNKPWSLQIALIIICPNLSQAYPILPQNQEKALLQMYAYFF